MGVVMKATLAAKRLMSAARAEARQIARTHGFDVEPAANRITEISAIAIAVNAMRLSFEGEQLAEQALMKAIIVSIAMEAHQAGRSKDDTARELLTLLHAAWGLNIEDAIKPSPGTPIQ